MNVEHMKSAGRNLYIFVPDDVVMLVHFQFAGLSVEIPLSTLLQWDDDHRLRRIKPNELAIVKNEKLISVGELLPKGSTMIDLIAAYDGLKGRLDNVAAQSGGKTLDHKLLKPPVENPSKIWAAAGNYKRGTTGLDDARGRGTAAKTSPEELLENIFLKPPSAIAGPTTLAHAANNESCMAMSR